MRTVIKDKGLLAAARYTLTRSRLPWLMLCMLAVVFIISMALPAQAAPLQYELPDGSTVACPDSGLFTARVVLCVQAGLQRATTYYLALFSAMMTPAVWAAVTLAMTFFGVRVATGQIPPNRMWPASSVFLFKIGLVSVFAFNMGGLVPVIYGTMTDVENIVTSSLIRSSPHCAASLPGSASLVWDRLDCALGKVIGFGSTTAITGGLFALLGGALFSGIFAVAMFFVGITALFIMLCAVIRPVWVFLLAYTAVSFFMVLSPIFVPMLLFRSTTKYFEKWVDQIVLAMLQPLLVFAFLAFFMSIIDIAIYDGAKSFDAAVGTNLASHLRVPKPTGEPYIGTGTPGYDYHAVIQSHCKAVLSQPENTLSLAECISNTKQRLVPPVPSDTSPTMADSPDYNMTPRTPYFEFGSPAVHNRKIQSITVSLMSIILIFYLIMTTAQYIPQYAAKMIGVKSAFNVTAGHQFVDQAVRTGIEEAHQGMKRALADVKQNIGEAGEAGKKAVDDALSGPIPGMNFVTRGLPGAGEGFVSGVASKVKSSAMAQAVSYVKRKAGM